MDAVIDEKELVDYVRNVYDEADDDITLRMILDMICNEFYHSQWSKDTKNSVRSIVRTTWARCVEQHEQLEDDEDVATNAQDQQDNDSEQDDKEDEKDQEAESEQIIHSKQKKRTLYSTGPAKNRTGKKITKYKTSTDKDADKLKRLLKISKALGINPAPSMFKNITDPNEKVKIYLDYLKTKGLKGSPFSMTKQEIERFRKKRERDLELQDLDVGNIISDKSRSTRVRQTGYFSLYKTDSDAEQATKSAASVDGEVKEERVVEDEEDEEQEDDDYEEEDDEDIGDARSSQIRKLSPKQDLSPEKSKKCRLAIRLSEISGDEEE